MGFDCGDSGGGEVENKRRAVNVKWHRDRTAQKNSGRFESVLKMVRICGFQIDYLLHRIITFNVILSNTHNK
jgi:hypothetical protein